MGHDKSSKLVIQLLPNLLSHNYRNDYHFIDIIYWNLNQEEKSSSRSQLSPIFDQLFYLLKTEEKTTHRLLFT